MSEHFADIQIVAQDGAFFSGSKVGDLTIFTESSNQRIHVGTKTGAGSEITINNTSNQIEVGAHIVPKSNIIYDLGSSNMRFRDLYLSGSTINLGGSKISVDSSNNLVVKDDNDQLKKLVVSEVVLGDATQGDVVVLKAGANGALDVGSTGESVSVFTAPSMVTSNLTASNIEFKGELTLNGVPFQPSSGGSGGSVAGLSNNGSNVFVVPGSNFGVGTSTPQSLLHVSGNARFDGDIALTQKVNLSGVKLLKPTSAGLQNITSSSGAAVAASTSVAGIVQLVDSVSSLSTSNAATPSAVKSAYDVAVGASNAAFARVLKTGDTMTGTLTVPTITSSNINASNLSGNGSNLTNLNAASIATGTVPTARLPGATTSVAGVVQLVDSTSSISTSNAATPNAVKTAYDLATTASNVASLRVLKSGDTMTGTLNVPTLIATTTNTSNLNVVGTSSLAGAISVGGNIVPTSNLAYDIGTSNMRFRDLYLSGSTINLGGTKLSSDSNNNVVIKDNTNALKKLVVSELQIGDSETTAVRIKLDPATNNVSFSQVSGNVEMSSQGLAPSNNTPAPGPTTTQATVDSMDAVNIDLTKNWSVLGTTGPVWGAAVDGANADTAVSMNVDGQNNIIVAGNYSGSSTVYTANAATSSGFTLPTASSTGAFLVKYNTAGVPQWTAAVEGSGPETMTGVVTDKANNVYVSGTYSNATPVVYSSQGLSAGPTVGVNIGAPTNSNQSSYVVKYDSTGLAKWATYSSGSNAVSADSIAVSDNSNVYVAGKYVTTAPSLYNGSGGGIGSAPVTTLNGSRGTQGPGTGWYDHVGIEMFKGPWGVCTDTTGANLYVADLINHRVRKIVVATGIVTTFVGSGSAAFADGTGTSASFYSPHSICIDSTGINMYVSDGGNHRIRKIIVATGVVTTLAGSGTGTFADGTGTGASFNYPGGVCIDSTSSNIYVADDGNHRIRKIVISSGVVTTLAGSGTGTLAEGTGTSASFFNPTDLRIDPTGTNIYVCDKTNHRIRKIVVATTAVSTFAGTQAMHIDGTGTNAGFVFPFGLCIDSSGTNIYVADLTRRIRKIVVSSAQVSSVAGSGSNFSADGVGTNASFKTPYGIGIDPNGTNLYVSDYEDHRIRKVAIGTQAVTTFAGSGTAGYLDTFDKVYNSVLASFNNPLNLCIDPTGTNVYVADQNNQRIRKIVIATGIVSTFAGSGTAAYAEGVGTGASFYNAFNLCIDPAGNNMYVADQGNSRIRRIAMATGVVTTFAGSGAASFADGTGTGASFSNPNGVCIDSSGANMYIADQSNRRIRKIVVATGVVTTLAGSGTASFADGTGTNASFNNPAGVCIDASETNLYVADQSNNRIRKIVISSGVVTTLAGSGTAAFADGTGTNAQFSGPTGICIDSTSSTVYVSEFSGGRVRKITVATGQVTLLVASLTSPYGICIDPTGTNLYIAQQNNRIRTIAIATQAVTTLAGSGTGTFADSPNGLFNGIHGIGVDPANNIYVTEVNNNTIRKIHPTTGYVSTLAGNPALRVGMYHAPLGVCIDPTGTNVYVADYSNHRIRKIVVATGVVSTLAGSGTATFADGTGTGASFYGPYGVCIDATGTNIYVSDINNHRIRKIVVATGVVSTLAGSDTGQFLEGTGTNARFNSPTGVCIDATGTNIYVADNNNHRIRKIVVATGQVTTLAGSNPGFFDSQGLNASFTYPYGVCIDPTDTNIYVADGSNNRVRKIVLASGVVTTLAGSNTSSFADGVGTNALFSDPRDVCIDPTGAAIYVVDVGNQRVRKIVVSTAQVTTFAGSGTYAFADGTGAAACFSGLRGICIDRTGTNIYLGDVGNHRIRAITVATQQVSTLSGTGVAGYRDDSVISAYGANGSFSFPSGTCVDPTGTCIYVADQSHHRIRKSVVATGVVTTLAGSETATFADGTGTTASFWNPNGVCIDSTGTNVYVADQSNHRIRKIVVATGVVTTLAGSGTQTFADATGGAASFNQPFGVCIDSTGTNIYVADQSNHRIRKIVVATGVVTTLAGSGTGTFADGTGTSASFNSPSGIGVDPTGTSAYIADVNNNRVRKIVIATGQVSTFAGSANSSFTDGFGTSAYFWGPFGLCIDPTGTNIYVADYNNHRVRKIAIANAQVTTLAGSGTGTFADGIGTSASFKNLFGVCIDPTGTNVYVADSSNHRIRAINIATQVVNNFASTGTNAFLDTPTLFTGTGTLARFNNPTSVCFDSSSNAYVADYNNNQIRKISSTGVVTPFVGSPTGVSGSTNGTGTGASFSGPSSVCIDTASTLYVADRKNNLVRKITSAGVVTTLASGFNNPIGVCVDSSLNVYVADMLNHCIKKVTSAGVVTTFAGSTGSVSGYLDAVGTNARFNTPYAVAVDLAGNVLVCDQGNERIRRISPQGIVATIVGKDAYGNIDANGTLASFSSPTSIWVSAAGDKAYVTDSYENTLRQVDIITLPALSGVTLPAPISSSQPAYIVKYDPAGTALFTVAINGSASICTASSLAVDASENFYISGTYTATPTLSSTSTGAITLRAASSTASYVAEYNSSGIPQWAASIDGVSNDSVTSITVDAVQNVFVCGFYTNSTNPPTLYNAANVATITLPSLTSATQAAFVAKYTSTGTPLWAAVIDGVGSDQINKIRVDATGSVYVAGQYSSSTTTPPTIYNADGTASDFVLPTPQNTQSKGFIVAYNGAGGVQDCFQVDGSGAQALNDIGIDTLGNIFVVGNYATSAPIIYNNKSTNPSSVTLPTPQNTAAYLVKYSRSALTNYNLMSTLQPANNGFMKYITNNGPLTTTINVKQSDASSGNQTTFQLLSGQSASLGWFNKWHKLT